MNIIARLEYELAYYDSAVHRFNHYPTRTPHKQMQWYQENVVIISKWHRQHAFSWLSLSLSPHLSLSSLSPDRSPKLTPVSIQSWCKLFLPRWPTLACPCAGVHRRTLFMGSSLLLQQCPACLIRLTWTVFEAGSKRSYYCGFMGYCCQNLFKTARSIFV